MLQVERHANDVLFDRVPRDATHQRVAQSYVAHGLLCARIDDGPALHRADVDVRGQQSGRSELQRHDLVAVRRVLAM